MAEEIHWRKIHKRKNAHLLFAEDLGPPGTKADVEIVDSGVTKVSSVDGEEDIPWIGFKAKSKRLGLSRTNCKSLEAICGTPIVNRWRGPITLVVIRTMVTDRQTKQRVEMDSIRISPKRPGNDNRKDGDDVGTA